MRAVDEESARGALAWLLKRRWAISAVRKCARLALAHLELVGRGAAAAERRKAAGIEASAQACRVSCWAARGQVAHKHRGKACF